MNILDLFLKAGFLVQLIMLVLMGFSIISWAIIIQRSQILNLTTRKTETFEDSFRSSIELSLLYKECQTRCNTLIGVEQIFYSGFKEFAYLCQTDLHAPELVMIGTSRVMRISMNRELGLLEVHIPFLGMIGSISPYIGLFGTVWGIIHSFISLGSVKHVTLQMIGPGIAESLIATMIGLFVAIPAIMGYNHLTQQINKLEQSYDNFMEEFLAILHRQTFNVKEQ